MKILFFTICLTLLAFSPAFSQDKTTGSVRGKVKTTSGDSISNVLVQARQDDKDVASAKTDGKGDFTISSLKPGVYTFVFTKQGLSEGTLTNVEVKSNTMLTLKRLTMSVDQGTLAVVRGSVFDSNGRSVQGAKVEIAKISGDSLKRIGEGYSSQSGEFVFRLSPDAARYRITVNIRGAETASKDIEINGAQIYSTAISLKAAKQ